MTGLQKEIEKRREGLQLTKNEMVSVSYIGKIIGTSYNTTRRKLENASFSVDEAVKIFNAIPFKTKNKFDAFVYLFTEQGD